AERMGGAVAEMGVLDVGGDDHAARPEAGDALELLRGGMRLDQRHRADEGEPAGVVGGPLRERIVQHPVPGDAGVERQAVAENVRPGADDLALDALLVEPGEALRYRLDQARAKGARPEPLVGMKCRTRPG